MSRSPDHPSVPSSNAAPPRAASTAAEFAAEPQPAGTGTAPETYCSSGTSPTVHLVGVGKVGCELLARFGQDGRFRLIAVSDSSGTILRRDFLQAERVLAHKRAGGRIASLPGAASMRTALAVDVVDADVVLDATPSSEAHVDEARACGDAVLRRGGRIALSGKLALSRALDVWCAPAALPRVGINAVLGGAGAALATELPSLRAETIASVACGNATTTRIIEVLECGGTIDQGIDEARRAGLLEPDPELDLTGADLAVKLAIVAGLLRSSLVDVAAIPRPDVRSLDVDLVRERARRGYTTRLVARSARDGSLSLRFEELPRGSAFAVPFDRVVYGYEFADGSTRVHVGAGVGPSGTAAALWSDLERLCETLRSAEGGAR